MSGPVHPRSRGEHLHPAQERSVEGGSSPLARGTLVEAALDAGVDRFIPARAGNTSRSRRSRCGQSVHPRSRGEHIEIPSSNVDRTGSSPLARGTRNGNRGVPRSARFIPARAGNTARPSKGRCSCTVHPRSRGEHSVAHPESLQWCGSSPLARGTLAAGDERREVDRFIPARAGNTVGVPARVRVAAVHPRSRGEHMLSRRCLRMRPGSSPLARGTPDVAIPDGVGQRFIPARAGNTAGSLRGRTGAAVHPRSRGEHPIPRSQPCHSGGSSPLARGTPANKIQPTNLTRFIPARAGNTLACLAATASVTVHPRSRGEHRDGKEIVRNLRGSSPLARGTHVSISPLLLLLRFIPARAGNTGARGARYATPAVHPRSRGEHDTTVQPAPDHSGSSPLARGTPSSRTPPEYSSRFIPARAGNTKSRWPPRSAGAVHPRSRGEHVDGRGTLPAMPGSSPLARGTPPSGIPRPTRDRFIPARAGNTRGS